MHEATLVSSLLTLVVEEASKHKVLRITTVRVSIGVLTAVEQETFRGCFALFAEGTVAEAAHLFIEMVPAQGHCLDCGHCFSLATLHGLCPQCQGMRLEISGGREFCLTGLEASELPEKGSDLS